MQTKCRLHRIAAPACSVALSRCPWRRKFPPRRYSITLSAFRRLASTSDGPNHRGPPLCTDLTHSLHHDGMARSWGKGTPVPGRRLAWRRLSRPTRDHREEITSVALNAYFCALKRHIINEIEKSFAGLTGGAFAKIVCRMSSKGRRPPQKLVSCMSSAYGAPHTAQFRIPGDNAGGGEGIAVGDCND